MWTATAIAGPQEISASTRLPLKYRVPLAAVFLLGFGALFLVRQPSAPILIQPAERSNEPAAIGRGRYLVQAANCSSCHTAENGQPLAGGKPFETTYGFLGKIYSSNITPDRETGIGNWTQADFTRAMRLGMTPGGERLFPAFPYPSFTKLSDADIGDIFAYLRTLAPVHAVAPPNSFWFRQRWALSLWNAWFFKPVQLDSEAQQSAEWNRGRYLVEALGHCDACHTPRNVLLAERPNTPLTGGLQLSEVDHGKTRLWSSPNLTSASSGLVKWTEDDLQKYIKTGNNRRTGVFGPMNEVVTNSLQYLTDADAHSMAVYLKSLPVVADNAQQILSEADSATGKALYDKHCEECHLATGRGGFRKAPPIAGSLIVQSQNPASLINVILYGANPDKGIPTTFNSWEEMPGFGKRMTDIEVAHLANFLRTSWGNRGDKVSPDSVAAQR